MRKNQLALAIVASMLGCATLAHAAPNSDSKVPPLMQGVEQPTQYSLKNKPNIIVFVMDDLGYGQVNYDDKAFQPDYLQQLKLPKRYQSSVEKAIDAAKKATPTIHNLAESGIRLTQGFVAHGVSGPSRAAIMTARMPSRYGIYSNNDVNQGVPTTEHFLVEDLRNHGYYTAAIGKWHMCANTKVKVPEDRRTRDYHDNFTKFCNEPYQPQNRGFDYFFGFHASGAAYYNSPALFRGRERAAPEGYLTDQITDETLAQIKKAGDTPFFMYVAYNAPHIPLQHDAPKPYQIFNTGNHDVDNYYAYVYAADQGIKRIIEQLKKDGKYANTLFFFTSDNGSVIDAPLPMNGQYKGYKGEPDQGGVHVPLIVSWQDGIKGGKTYAGLVSAADIMPTALAAAGIDLSAEKEKPLDGVNLLPYLNGKADNAAPHQYLWWIQPLAYHWDTRNIPFWEGYDAYIDGDRDAPPKNPNLEKDAAFTWTIRDKDWTLNYYAGDNRYSLYKNSDASESNDVIKDHPDVVKRLKAEMQTIFAERTAKPLTDNNLPKYEQLKKTVSE